MDFYLKLLSAVFGLVSVSAAVYNLLTAHRRAKQLHRETQEVSKLDSVYLLSTKNEQRLNALEARHNSLEARVERRLEQIAGDISKVKDLFTEYIIKNH